MFITGCDQTTQWMLPWFIKNFRIHNPNAIIGLCDFGLDNPTIDSIGFDFVIDVKESKGWFKKPFAIDKALRIDQQVCWLDTDCEVLGNLDEIFDYSNKSKVGLVRDYPWTKRKNSLWYNTGVVLFNGRPPILKTWKEICVNPTQRGDQEQLHEYLKKGLNSMIHVKELPHRFNVLRLDIQDKSVPYNPLIMHWTGYKGKDEIKKKMKNVK